MTLRKERAAVICGELKNLMRVRTVPITDWKILDGLYFRPEEADASGGWKDFDSRTSHWEGLDKHYWFKTEVAVPPEFDGKSFWLVFKTQIDDWDDGRNPQFLVFLDGVPVQGMDINHRSIRVAEKAAAGQKYRVDLQAYTGILHADLMLVAEMTEIDPEIAGLYYDIQVPLWSLDKQDPDCRTRIDLELALENTINKIDLREPYSEEFRRSVKDADAYIRKAVYEDLAGFDDVIATCIGHTHIDVAWWWTVAQTREKAARSFSTVLKLMDEYPEYKFMSSQPQLYQFVEERYPELFARIQKRVAEGRWEPEGGMWVEADCNLISGESMVRQFLYGKRYFREKFGVENTILWLPDVFGYSAAMPQILKKSGIKYFMTTKIAWNEFNKFPYDTFWWKGIDGTDIFTYLITTKGVGQPKDSFFTTYNGMLHPDALIGAWERYQQKEFNNDVLVAYGYGDGGGGPTREMLETGVRMEKGIKGSPKVRMEFSRKFFDELYDRCAKNPRLPEWNGELYLEFHRGTYTSMARNKRSNRKMEFALQDLEFLSVWAEKSGVKYPKEELDALWHNVLLNQFHDILPGSSIHEVYEVTKKEYADMAERTRKLIAERLEAVARPESGSMTVLNTLSFARDDGFVFEAEDEIAALEDETGTAYPVQRTADGRYAAHVKGLPPKGLKMFRMQKNAPKTENRLTVTDVGIETPFYIVSIDKKGMFTSIYDKEAGRQVLKKDSLGNVLRVYEDKPTSYDNWNIDIFYTEKSWPADDVQKLEWIEKGPVRAVLLVERKFCSSLIRQKICFYADSRRIDFDTYVDWKEHQQLLKAEFEVDYNAAEATYDIQFGNIKRPTHANTSWDRAKFEVCAHKWADISQGDYGLSILNDCKYGHAIRNGKISLTLIKSGIEPNKTADQEEHRFVYSILPHRESWQQANTVQEAYKLNVPVYTVRNSSKKSAAAPAKSGDSLLSLSASHVIAETVKKSEDGKSVIVRLYEFENRGDTVELAWRSCLKRVYECDLMENRIGEIKNDGEKFQFSIKPYEIKTFELCE